MDDIGRILTGDMDPPGTSDLDDTHILLVGERVVAGAPVLFIYRDDPADGDTGWVLLAGTEPDEELSDAKRFEERTLAWAVETDPTLGSILGAPPDSAFERDSVAAPWVELEED
jgi:hypothetical protein